MNFWLSRFWGGWLWLLILIIGSAAQGADPDQIGTSAVVWTPISTDGQDLIPQYFLRRGFLGVINPHSVLHLKDSHYQMVEKPNFSSKAFSLPGDSFSGGLKESLQIAQGFDRHLYIVFQGNGGSDYIELDAKTRIKHRAFIFSILEQIKEFYQNRERQLDLTLIFNVDYGENLAAEAKQQILKAEPKYLTRATVLSSSGPLQKYSATWDALRGQRDFLDLLPNPPSYREGLAISTHYFALLGGSQRQTAWQYLPADTEIPANPPYFEADRLLNIITSDHPPLIKRLAARALASLATINPAQTETMLHLAQVREHSPLPADEDEWIAEIIMRLHTLSKNKSIGVASDQIEKLAISWLGRSPSVDRVAVYIMLDQKTDDELKEIFATILKSVPPSTFPKLVSILRPNGMLALAEMLRKLENQPDALLWSPALSALARHLGPAASPLLVDAIEKFPATLILNAWKEADPEMASDYLRKTISSGQENKALAAARYFSTWQLQSTLGLLKNRHEPWAETLIIELVPAKTVNK